MVHLRVINNKDHLVMFQSIMISFGVITSIAGMLGIIAYFITILVDKSISRSYLKELITDTGCLIVLICWGISILEILAIRC